MIKKKEIKDTFQAFLVNGAQFTDIEEYPIIEKNMISRDIPKKIIPFNKYKQEKNLSECFICFYASDESFERIRRNPKKYLKVFRKCKGIIGLDFSVHVDMPLIKQKSQINDNLSLTYYYGANGIKILPNIRYGIDDTSDEFFMAIPHNTLLAIGTHGFMQLKTQQYNWLREINKIIDVLQPTGIIVYGHLTSKIFNSVKERVPIYCFEPWTRKRKEKTHGVKRTK